MNDREGRLLKTGDRVASVQVAPGAPAWAVKGTVVGFTAKKIRVQWDGWAYELARTPFHSTTSPAVRKLEEGQS